MPAAEPVSQIHDRQQAILAPDAYYAWLDPSTPAADVKPLLSRNLDGDLQFYLVERPRVFIFATQEEAAQFLKSNAIEPLPLKPAIDR